MRRPDTGESPRTVGAGYKRLANEKNEKDEWMNMDERYQRWIEEHIPADCEGACKIFAEEMHEAFPELRVVCGRYFRPEDSPADHWWCVTKDGEIVDPTARQFELDREGRTRYKVDSKNYTADENISGKCPRCGKWCYDGDEYCSAKCELDSIK